MHRSRIFRLSLVSLLSVIFYLSANTQEKTITYPFDPSYQFEDRQIEIYHLKADLEIFPFDTLVIGEAEFSFKILDENLDSIVFSVPELDIKKVNIDGSNADFRVKGNQVLVFPTEKFTWQTHHKISFTYTAKPTEGLYFIGWNDPQKIRRKQIWGHRPDHWLPYSAAILTVEMSVTVPDDQKVFSNGVRESIKSNKNGTKTWNYRMNHPHPFFSTCLVIGDYEYKNLKTARGLPLELWYYPDHEDHFEPTYRYQAEMFSFFEEEFGFNYPWELYRQAPVTDYLYGAMETTTATVFGDFLMVDDRGFTGRNYVNVNAHELAHQWFGNYISHLKTKDVWLTESFATYFAKKFEQHIYGEDYYQNIRVQELEDTYTAAKRNNYGVGHAQGGRERFYPKGSLVMDMLRDVLGEKEFKASIKYYLENNPYQAAETCDFLQAIRKTTGRSLEWFFEEWIYRGGEPFYEVAYKKLIPESGIPEIRIKVDQIHETNALIGLFNMPMDFEIHYSDGTIDKKTQWIESKHEEVVIKNPDNKPVDFVLFDPGRKIIKKVKFERTYQELIAQAEKAPNMIDRYDALLAMRNTQLSEKESDLIRIYQKEKFHLTKSEIIAQLALSRSPEVELLMKSALHDQDDKVRLAVVQNLLLIPENLKTDYETLLYDSSYINLGLALENLCNSFPENCTSYLEKTVQETGWRGLNIKIKWLEIAIYHGFEEHLPELINYSGPSFEFETRINVFEAFKRLNLLNPEIVQNMLEGMLHWNYKIRNAAQSNLREMVKQTQWAELVKNIIITSSFSGNQKMKLFQALAIN